MHVNELMIAQEFEGFEVKSLSTFIRCWNEAHCIIFLAPMIMKKVFIIIIQ